MKRVILSPEREALFRAEWADNRVTLGNIETSMGHTGETLRRMAAELGLAPREEPNPWTPDFTALIVRRYGDGESPTLLGLEFGLTRNQVTSKLQRLGVIRRRVAEPTPPKAAVPRQAVPVAAAPTAAPAPPLRVIIPFTARARACAWPIGDPRNPDYRSCGAAAEYGPYCAEHTRRAYVSSPPPKTRPYAVRGG